MLCKQPAIATSVVGLRLRPSGQAACDLGRLYEEVEPAVRDVQLDEVASAYGRERTASRRLRCGVDDHGAERGAAHTGIADPYHVADALLQEFLGDGQVADLRHTWPAQWPAVLQDEDTFGCHRQVGVVDAGAQIVHVPKDDGSAAVLQQGRGGGAVFDDRAIQGKVAAQDGKPAFHSKVEVRDQRQDMLLVSR